MRVRIAQFATLLFAGVTLLQAQATSGLLRQLREGEAPQRVAAAKALVNPRPTPATVNALLAALRDPDPIVRIAVLTSIGFINRPAAEIVQPTALLLGDPDLAVVHVTLRLLANWSFRAAIAAPHLRLLLSHEAPEIRGEVIEVLTPLVNVTRVASDALVEALDDEAPGNRAAAAYGLAKSGAVPPDAVPKLALLLSDEDDRVANLSVAALVVARKQASPALPQLINALKHPNEHVRRLSADAIGRIGSDDPAAFAALTQTLEDRSPAVVQAAREALQQIHTANDP